MKTLFEYECWKCSEWHQTDRGGFFSNLRYGFSAQRLNVFGLTISIPNFVGDRQIKQYRKQLDKNLSLCSECGNYFPKEKLWQTHWNERFCEQCM